MGNACKGPEPKADAETSKPKTEVKATATKDGKAEAKDKDGKAQHWVIAPTDKLESKYDVGKKIGQDGQFGHALVITDKKDKNIKRVAKVIQKNRFNPQHFPEFAKEIKLYQQLDHPNLVKGYEYFETSEKLYIVLEFCGGGELFDRITKHKKYSEKDARAVLRQLVDGLVYLHSKNLAHLDLKPDNLLFLDEREDAPLKIIDFGLSQYAKKRQYLTKFAGTSYYIAPEVLRGKYSYHADIWSTGVIMFILLFGFPPFHGDSDEVIHNSIKRGFDPVVKPGYGPWFPAALNVSASARDLIAKMLVMDQAQRITAAEILEHPWMSGKESSDEPLGHVMEQLNKFTSTSRFKANLLIALGDMLSDDEVVQLNASFRKLDKNGDGQISIAELQEAMKEGKFAEENKSIMNLMQTVDLDGDGHLSYQELVAASVNRKLLNKEERLWNLFCSLDVDGNGSVTAAELAAALGKSGLAAEEMVKEVDKNGDGTVDYEEFLEMWVGKEEAQYQAKLK